MWLGGRRQGCGLLGGVGVLVAFIDFQLGHEHTTEAVFGNHAANRVSDEFFRLLGADLRYRSVFLAALPAGITHERFVRLLLSGQPDFGRVDHDHEIARIEVRCIDGFVLPAQDVGHLCG